MSRYDYDDKYDELEEIILGRREKRILDAEDELSSKGYVNDGNGTYYDPNDVTRSTCTIDPTNGQIHYEM